MPQGFLIGATDKGASLDDRMKAVFQEFIIETGPDSYEMDPAAQKAVTERFARIWKEVGQPMTPLKLTILAILLDAGPMQLDDLFGAVQEDKPTDQKTFTSAVKGLLEGDLVTMNEKRMRRPG
jgi:hypothetical protein